MKKKYLYMYIYCINKFKYPPNSNRKLLRNTEKKRNIV